MKKPLLIITATIILFATACLNGLKTEQILGRWKYIKVGVPNSSPPDTVTTAELEENKPFIDFKSDGNFSITWGGKILSHGTYKLSGKNINVHEVLPEGQSRDFPFFVSEITDKQITFETTVQGGSRVTAVRE
ncbi:hypothetical protein [Mucilaginibacter agri]|uniref:Lipocalin-like domain-containing protein n=1 Tax=Mucilaginibacter agri TaxID=2695265 RepID=A0A965ZJS4_9SPHI|nr:hypothetical protein [Mucilaginibacter agri]NCD70926.1 hypothetical protein [Mucilaginibacter agri]